MARSDLLYNELHCNSLITNWGLCNEMSQNFTQIAVQTKSFPKRRLCLRYYMNVCSRLLGKQSKKSTRDKPPRETKN